MLEKAKLRLRITTDALGNDIQQLIDEAETDLNRIGISKGNALYTGAVLCYVQANFGNNPDREKLMDSYHMFIIRLKGQRQEADT